MKSDLDATLASRTKEKWRISRSAATATEPPQSTARPRRRKAAAEADGDDVPVQPPNQRRTSAKPRRRTVKQEPAPADEAMQAELPVEIFQAGE